MSASKLKKKKETEALRPPTAFQIGEIGEGDHLSSICTLFNESMDVLLAWEKRRKGKTGGAKQERCEWAEWE